MTFPLALILGTTLLHAAGITLPYSLSTVAGGTFVNDGGVATASPLQDAEGICEDKAGNIYLADSGDSRVRIIVPNGTISTVAGNGVPGLLTLPYGVAVDAGGNIYVADLGNNRIQKIAPDGTATTVLDHLASPRNLVLDAAGNIYFSEFSGQRVRKIAVDGTLTVIAGTGVSGSDGDGGLAQMARLSYPAGLAIDVSGALYIADSGNHKIRRVAGGKISTVLGTGVSGLSSPNQLSTPTAVVIDAAGNMYVADFGNKRVRKITTAGVVSTIAVAAKDLFLESSGSLIVANGANAYRVFASGVVTTIAGDGSYLFRGDGGLANQARLNAPSGVALDSSGNLWISDTGNSRVRMVNANGQIGTQAGGGGLPTSPIGISADVTGNVFIADAAAYRVEELPAKVSAILDVAGNGTPGAGIDGIPATASSLATPNAVAAGPGGAFYIADTGNAKIRRVSSSGIITTLGGSGAFNHPSALCVDANSNVYIADTGSNRILLLTPGGQVSTIAGPAQLLQPRGVAVDPAGNVWISDTGNHRVLVLPPGGSLMIVTTQLIVPVGLTVDGGSGTVYVADQGSNSVVMLTPPAPALTEAPGTLPVVNAATLLSGPVALGSIVSIFGSGLAQAQPFFDGQIVVPLLAQDSQINVQVPANATGAFELKNAAVSLLKTVLVIVPAAPGIFTGSGGTGPVIASNQDGSLNSAVNPASQGDIVTFYATGFGQGNMISVTIGGASAVVLYGGNAPGLLGVNQVNAQVPTGLLSGSQPLFIQAGTVTSQTSVTLAVR